MSTMFLGTPNFNSIIFQQHHECEHFVPVVAFKEKSFCGFCTSGAVDPGGGGGGGCEGDDASAYAVDMSKLLSSENGGRPNLSRRLMTHLRLLQADLQYLKVRKVVWGDAP